MKIELPLRSFVAASPERSFDFTNDAANLVSFVGYGPIPGIREAVYETPGEPTLGSRRRVSNTDGTEHAEEIVAFERPSRHTTRITGIAPPFAWLVRYGEDEWRFTERDRGTEIDRTFTFELTTPLAAPVAWLILHTLMRAAVRRDLANVARALESAP